MPVRYTRRSPSAVTSRPLAGANSSRATANELTTTDAAVTLTLKLRANVGSAGATNPNPAAITKFAATSTHTSLGNRVRVVSGTTITRPQSSTPSATGQPSGPLIHSGAGPRHPDSQVEAMSNA
jgi:hypothetical protein